MKNEKVIIIIGSIILIVLALLIIILIIILINGFYNKYNDAYPEMVIRAELVGEVYHNGNILLLYERADGVILTINKKNNFGLTDEDIEIELVYKKTGNIKYYVRKALLVGNPSNNMLNDFKTIGTVNYKFVGINKIK